MSQAVLVHGHMGLLSHQEGGKEKVSCNKMDLVYLWSFFFFHCYVKSIHFRVLVCHHETMSHTSSKRYGKKES
jgi:hypothetical protein